MNQEPTTSQDPSVLPQTIPQPAPSSPNSKVPFHKKVNIFAGKEKIELISLVVIILLAAAGAFAYGRMSKHSSKPASIQKTQVAVTAPNAANSTSPKLPDAKFLSGNTYLDSPKKLSGVSFLKDLKALGCDTNNTDCTASNLDINYYQIGSTAKAQPIIVMTYVAGPGGDSYLYAIQTQPGQYSLLAQNSYDVANFASTWQPSLSPSAVIDDKTKLNDITMPLQLTIKGQAVKVSYAPSGATNIGIDSMSMMKNGLTSIRGGYFDDVSPSAITKLDNQGNIDYYEVTANDSANYKVIELHGVYKQLFSASYNPAGEIAGATDALKIKWSSGVNNTSSYFSAGQGCGSTGYVIAKNVSSSDLKKVGATPGGQAVFQLPQSNPLVQEIFNKDYAGGQYVDDSSLKNLSIDQFTNQHGYFLAVNGLGENVLFLRNDLIVHGGCAKPVIYLYPQTKQQVSVKVGAQVVNSLPDYGSGWNDVTAYPDGSLTYNGKIYGNLFWDGYGSGAYPQISRGAIVKTQDAVSAVRKQLADQGINGQETSDFLAYWQPKLERAKTPYIRLSWLNTDQMNQLAPLDISPRPQTLIRVFLDFEPVNKPYPIKPQTFIPLQRNGFTVVEWGGLTRDGF